MWNNCTTHQMSEPSEGSSFSSPRVRVSRNNNTLQLFLQPLSPRYGYYASHIDASPVYAFPYPIGSPIYSPRGIGRRFGLVPATPRSPLRLSSPRADVAAGWPRMVEAAAVLSPAVARGLNVSWMSTTRGINYGPVAEDLSSLKMDRFKVRIVELGHDDDDGHKS